MANSSATHDSGGQQPSNGRHVPHATQACETCQQRHKRCSCEFPVCGTCSQDGKACTWSEEKKDGRSSRHKVANLSAELELQRGKVADLTAKLDLVLRMLGQSPTPVSLSANFTEQETSNAPMPSYRPSSPERSRPRPSVEHLQIAVDVPLPRSASSQESWTFESELSSACSSAHMSPFTLQRRAVAGAPGVHTASSEGSSGYLSGFTPGDSVPPSLAFTQLHPSPGPPGASNVDDPNRDGSDSDGPDDSRHAADIPDELSTRWGPQSLPGAFFPSPNDYSRHLPEALSDQLSIGDHDNLLHLFFMYAATWQGRLIPWLFVRDMFAVLSGSRELPQRRMHYSPALHNAVLAEACTLMPEGSWLRGRDVREHFARQAREQIDKEARRLRPGAHISIVQALALLAHYHLGLSQDSSQATLYYTMAVRISRIIDVGGLKDMDGGAAHDNAARVALQLALYCQDTEVFIVHGPAAASGFDRCHRLDGSRALLERLQTTLPESTQWPYMADVNLSMQAGSVLIDTYKLYSAAALRHAHPTMDHDIVKELKPLLYSPHIQSDTDTAISPHFLALHITCLWVFLTLETAQVANGMSCRILALVSRFHSHFGLQYAPLTVVFATARAVEAQLAAGAIANVNMGLVALEHLSVPWRVARQLARRLRVTLERAIGNRRATDEAGESHAHRPLSSDPSVTGPQGQPQPNMTGYDGYDRAAQGHTFESEHLHSSTMHPGMHAKSASAPALSITIPTTVSAHGRSVSSPTSGVGLHTSTSLSQSHSPGSPSFSAYPHSASSLASSLPSPSSAASGSHFLTVPPHDRGRIPRGKRRMRPVSGSHVGNDPRVWSAYRQQMSPSPSPSPNSPSAPPLPFHQPPSTPSPASATSSLPSLRGVTDSGDYLTVQQAKRHRSSTSEPMFNPGADEDSAVSDSDSQLSFSSSRKRPLHEIDELEPPAGAFSSLGLGHPHGNDFSGHGPHSEELHTYRFPAPTNISRSYSDGSGSLKRRRGSADAWAGAFAHDATQTFASEDVEDQPTHVSQVAGQETHVQTNTAHIAVGVVPQAPSSALSQSQHQYPFQTGVPALVVRCPSPGPGMFERDRRRMQAMQLDGTVQDGVAPNPVASVAMQYAPSLDPHPNMLEAANPSGGTSHEFGFGVVDPVVFVQLQSMVRDGTSVMAVEDTTVPTGGNGYGGQEEAVAGLLARGSVTHTQPTYDPMGYGNVWQQP